MSRENAKNYTKVNLLYMQRLDFCFDIHFQRLKREIIRRCNDKFDALEFEAGLEVVHVVDMPVIAALDVVFVQNVHDLAADKLAMHRREMQKHSRFSAESV